MKLDLGMPGLFDDLLEIKLGDKVIDLHNNYSCVNIRYDTKEVKILFKSDNLTDDQFFCQIELLFGKAEIIELNFPLFLEGNGLCLDSFYRGRIEQYASLLDAMPDGRCLFYLEFYEGQSLQILAKSITVEVLTKKDLNISKH